MTTRFRSSPEHGNAGRALFDVCSNTGRWGPDDELGTLRHITPARRLAALATVRVADVVSIGKDLPVGRSRQVPPSVVHNMVHVDEDANAAIDFVSLMPHGYEVTHVDAVGHAFFDGQAYNGRRAREIITTAGLNFGSILAMRDGIVTRGVLLDVAGARGVAYLAAGEPITVADLERAERHACLRVAPGDAIFVRSGHDVRVSVEGSQTDDLPEGVAAEVHVWLRDREVAEYSGDCIEQLPANLDGVPMPLHQVGLAGLGLAILDVPDVEALAVACRGHGRSEFLLIVAPLRLPGGTGSAVNPLAIF
jgi:kynurenine formamidase